MEKKELKILRFQKLLGDVSYFLKQYLPIANAHMTDFIVKDWWNTLIPETVRKDLLTLSDTDLIMLPSGQLYSSDIYSKPGFINSVNHSEHLIVCGSVTKVLSGEIPLWDESVLPIWKHENLKDFITACRYYQLVNMNILTEISQLLGNTSDGMVVEEFMCLKKQHEVNLMAKICSAIAEQNHTDIVVDIGSGKGYLGSQLTLQHGLRVLGIDSSLSNTNGATERAQRLGKQWHGLVSRVKKDQLEEEQSSLQPSSVICQTSESTSLASGMGDSLHELTRTDSAEKPIGNGTISRNSSPSTDARFVAVTQYVNRYTDIQDLLRRHLIGSAGSDWSTTTSTLEKNTFRSSAKLDSDNYAARQQEYLEKAAGEKEAYLTIDQSSDFVQDGYTVSTENMSLEHSKLGCVSPLTSGHTDAAGGHTECSKQLMKESQSNYMIVGLHACGDLTPNTLRLFVEQPGANTLCHVGCCYHHLSEAFIRSPYGNDEDLDCKEKGFPLSEYLQCRGCQLGRNARMLASQALDRIASSGKTPDRSLYWRAVLQVILYDVTGENRYDWRVGKIARKCRDFNEYVEKAFTKLGFENKLPAIDVDNYVQRYSCYQSYIKCFVQLKAALAPCIETLILLDRACFLLEQDDVSDVHLVQAFNSVISPRCYAIIASKSPRK